MKSGKLILASASAIDSAKGYYIVIPEIRPTAPIVSEFCNWIRREAEKTLHVTGPSPGRSAQREDLRQAYNVVTNLQQP